MRIVSIESEKLERFMFGKMNKKFILLSEIIKNIDILGIFLNNFCCNV